eukprot:EST47641.1 hypothetical protein SS50377_12336 [Spironucleus salmonicida]
MMKEIIKTQPAAKLIDKDILSAWAQAILDGTHQSRTEPPEALVNDDSDGNDDGNDLDLGEDDEFGDIVTVKGQDFVVCSGLVVPQQLLKDKIIPLINETMEKLGIEVDDVFNALMTQ